MGKRSTPETKAPAIPDVHVLTRLVEEYQEMLREAERGVKKVLALNPQTEKFRDELTNVAPHFSLVGDRLNTTWEEITDLIDQLPED
jgi:hypothetical protein